MLRENENDHVLFTRKTAQGLVTRRNAMLKAESLL